MKTQTKTSAKTSTKRKGGNDFGSRSYSSQRVNGSSDIYQKFTDLIIEKLEQGVIPWKQPWHEMGMPSNYLTKKSGKSFDEVIKSLEKQGIATVKRENQEGRLYGITFVDHRTKCVFNGSALGKNYSAKGLMDRITNHQNRDGIAFGSVSKAPRMAKEIQNDSPQKTMDYERTRVNPENTSRGLLETVITPEQEYNYVPFEWRKKKRKKKKKVTK